MDENVKAYLAAACLFRGQSKISGGQSMDPDGIPRWCRMTALLLATWPELSERVAEFLGGLLFKEVVLPDFLLAALACKPPENVSPNFLAKRILHLCKGAAPSRLPKALLSGHQSRGWRSLHDPLLLPGELHALMIDEVRSHEDGDLRTFANKLKDRLASDNRPWLERAWPRRIDVGYTTEHDARVTALLVLSDGRVVTGDALGNLLVWDCERGERDAFKRHDGPVRALAELNRDGRCWVASAGADRTVRLSDLREKQMTQPRRHQGAVLALAVVGEGTSARILSGGEDGLIYDWSMATVDCLRPDNPQAHRGGIRFLRAPKGISALHVASAGEDGVVRIWKCGPEGLKFDRALVGKPHPRRITALACNSVAIVWGDELGRVYSQSRDEDKQFLYRGSHPGRDRLGHR